MFQKFIMIEQKNTQKLLKNFSVIFLFVLSFIFSSSTKADLSKCKNPEFQEKVRQVAKEEGVDSNELLSVIAHESRCNYFVIAWNLPGAPQTAKNKFFESLGEAKTFAEELIITGKYRVDIGIGQINYEANIKRKGWTFEEVLNPKTALNRVAQILKERGWAWYHSSNSFYAKKWRKLVLNALYRISPTSELLIKASSNKVIQSKKEKRQNSLLVYVETALGSSMNLTSPLNSSLKPFRNKKIDTGAIIIYGSL